MPELSIQQPSVQQQPEQDVRRAAMDLLARREHSYSELCYKLKGRFEAQSVETALNKLVDDGLQSDDRFAEAYVRARGNKGYGPARIRMELLQKGLSQSLISNYLFDDDDKWFEEASRMKTKKLREDRNPTSAERAKLYRFLAQRGFLTCHINACLS
ncbi:hypothetical protein GZ77_04605 [Endozoicomonas montiporae]|uniref:Regulatory protein RecX n=2 Tax=Endozoicomonas montiporae TaxID=1027273 RepID=A0A081NBJ3_9GAMM|nr:regulatory protein RecX [Endozoicomonas montiporae]AMO56100.1 recombination regulator RecX [Endozoicomonas montiporae CL-33]KEQ15816.1 hypothetical protein GZ77_04605 [Endozoicomonas montiporae]